MEYKIGDKVRVKTWEKMEKEFGLDYSNNIKCRCTFLKYMIEYCGKIVTIETSRDSCNHEYKIYQIKEDYGHWAWSNDMFEKVEPIKTTRKIKPDKTYGWDRSAIKEQKKLAEFDERYSNLCEKLKRK